MRALNIQEIKSIAGSALSYGDVVLVTDNSVWVTATGYTYYAHQAFDPNGRVVFNGMDGNFITYNGSTIQTRTTISGNGTYYVCAY